MSLPTIWKIIIKSLSFLWEITSFSWGDCNFSASDNRLEWSLIALTYLHWNVKTGYHLSQITPECCQREYFDIFVLVESKLESAQENSGLLFAELLDYYCIQKHISWGLTKSHCISHEMVINFRAYFDYNQNWQIFLMKSAVFSFEIVLWNITFIIKVLFLKQNERFSSVYQTEYCSYFDIL